ncbi:MAG: hypothetical protein LT070_07860, partial [Solirubrobacteraceae bacterium]|nr:hypothetical protein [Solirubrobacteraceae bacterium]
GRAGHPPAAAGAVRRGAAGAGSGGGRGPPPPAAFALEHLPSFEVDVVRRWPDVSKARERLGWEARIGVREGIAQTVDWLRERV